MGRKLHLHAIEPGRARKRISVPLSRADAVTVDHISAKRGFPNSRVVSHMIGRGTQLEYRARIALERLKWPKVPTNPKYVPAAFSELAIHELLGIAETAFEPLNLTASAMFQLGLAEYQAEQSEDADG